MLRLSPRRFVLLCALLAAVAASAATAFGQSRDAATEATFAGLEFRNIGPATMSGRIDDLAVLESNPAVFYVATATGGLWKTVNNGTTWEVLFDTEEVVSIGTVAIPAADASLVWVGTGENNNRQTSSWGAGVYKSTDGGHTWTSRGLADARHVAGIVIDPVDHDTVYVAAAGHLWGPNEARGIFKTTNGGRTWAKVLYVDADTGATDLVMDPTNNKVLYAATYQRRRAVWGFNGGGPGSAIHKSSDGGATWKRLTDGIPEGDLGRIGLDVYRRNPNVVYARIEHATESGVYRSDDGGERWTKMSDTNPRPMYFSEIRIDPNDDHRIYVLGVQLHMSDDGGRTFTSTTVPHSDHHALWIDPANSNHVVTGCDGGINISYDRGATWDFVDNMDLGQLYHVSYDMDVPYRVYGGLQDNASWGGPSAVRSRYGIGNFDWFNVTSGDGFVTIVDPTDPRTIYGESQGGNVLRVDRLSEERKAIKPRPPAGEPDLRWNWDTPMLISPHASSTVFVAANMVFRSTDRGHSWTAISPDLTAEVDRESRTLMGVANEDVTLSRNDGVSTYGTIVTFAESPMRAGLYYAGADDGTVHVSRDDGASWSNVSDRFSGLPAQTYVSQLTPSAFDEGTVYATFDNHAADDYRPYVYVSRDYGESWQSTASDLPEGQVVRCVTEDLENPNVLYLGTEFGLFVSLDRGEHWTRVRANLPTVPIAEITLHPRENDMLLATHGRSIWILDDITPFQQAAEALAQDAYLFEARPAMQYNAAAFRPTFAGPGDRRFWGQNPPFGASISYHLKTAADDVQVTIRDDAGSLVRTLSGEDTEDHRRAGINRLQWDLRHEPLPEPAPQLGGGGFGAVGPEAPFVLPGRFEVTLTVDGRNAGRRTVEVLGDRLMEITDADRRELYRTALALHELQRTSDETAEAVRALSEQIGAVEELIARAEAPPAPVTTAATEIAEQLTELRRQLGVPQPGAAPARRRAPNLRREISQLKGQVMASTSVPTEGQVRQTGESREQLAEVVGDVNAVITSTMPAMYRLLSEHSLQPGLMPIRAIGPIPTTSQP